MWGHDVTYDKTNDIAFNGKYDVTSVGVEYDVFFVWRWLKRRGILRF